MAKQELLDSAATLQTAREIALDAALDPERVWCGAYFFEVSDTVNKNPGIVYEYVEEAVRQQCSVPDALVGHCAGPDLLATSSDLAFRLYRKEDNTAKVVGFDCGGLASALFLAHLLDHLATSRGVVRADFADFASVETIKGLDRPEHVFALSTKGA